MASSQDEPKSELREDNGKTILVDCTEERQMQQREKYPYFKMEEVKKHHHRTDMWVLINNCVYDITSFVELHPGGALALSHAGGHECTDLFTEYHPAAVWKMLAAFQVGRLHPDSVLPLTEFARDRRAMRQKLLEMGLFDGSRLYYAFKVLMSFGFFAVSVMLLLWATKAEAVPQQEGRFWINAARTVAAMALGMFWQQMAFLGHDFGHAAATHNLFIDSAIGLFIGNLFTGISIGFWKKNHNIHHIIVNSVEHDPDIQHMPFLAISEKIFTPSAFDAVSLSSPATLDPSSTTAPSRAATSLKSTSSLSPRSKSPASKSRSKSPVRSATAVKSAAMIDSGDASVVDGVFYSSYHQRLMTFDGLARALISYQHWLYYPAMAVARYNLYLMSWLHALKPYAKQAITPLPVAGESAAASAVRISGAAQTTELFTEKVKWRPLEILMLAGFWTWLVCFQAFLLPGWSERFAFMMISHAVAGLLHVQITLSHFACDVYRGSPFAHPDDWCKIQLYTSINVDTDWSSHWFHGGLHMQIEHHMFPRLPRHSCAEAAKLIIPFCTKHNMPYRSMSFFDANCLVIKAMYKTAMRARVTNVVDTTMLWDGLNANG